MTSSEYPLIAVYYACTTFQVSIALACCVWVLRFYHHDPPTDELPRWVKVTWLQFLNINGKILVQKFCWTRPEQATEKQRVSQKLAMLSGTSLEPKRISGRQGNCMRISENVSGEQKYCMSYVVNCFLKSNIIDNCFGSPLRFGCL